MLKAARVLFNKKSGATVFEYVLIASLIVVFIMTAFQSQGTKLSAVFGEIAVAPR